jgi:hypothetical protein
MAIFGAQHLASLHRLMGQRFLSGLVLDLQSRKVELGKHRSLQIFLSLVMVLGRLLKEHDPETQLYLERFLGQLRTVLVFHSTLQGIYRMLALALAAVLEVRERYHHLAQTIWRFTQPPRRLEALLPQITGY